MFVYTVQGYPSLWKVGNVISDLWMGKISPPDTVRYLLGSRFDAVMFYVCLSVWVN